MRTTRTGEWYRLRAGHHAMTLWLGEVQVSYRALRGDLGWHVFRSVAGAAERTAILGDPHQTLREAKVTVEGDWSTGLF